MLYSFKGEPDGAFPYAGLIFDSSGALYGTTAFGGTARLGTVFKLKPSGHETLLYSFKGGKDGIYPYASLLIDSKGALYGTTQDGGTYGQGTVFKLKPPAPPGQTLWTEKVLYSFTGLKDGAGPVAGLTFDKEGALYGTAAEGGGPGFTGTVFKLTPPAPGKTQWTETVLHSFSYVSGKDGFYPAASLIFDSTAALYGTTKEGGTLGFGTVFKLTPPVLPAKKWTETVLKHFPDGFGLHIPLAGLISNTKGAHYGTTYQGGASNWGTVFKVQ